MNRDCALWKEMVRVYEQEDLRYLNTIETLRGTKCLGMYLAFRAQSLSKEEALDRATLLDQASDGIPGDPGTPIGPFRTCSP